MHRVDASMLAPAVVEARVIPNGVALSSFRPADKRAVRAKLGIAENTRVLLFSAHGIRHNIWKDYRMLRDAVARASEALSEEMLCIALGEDAPAEHVGRSEIRFVPYQTDTRSVARYYQASDVYVHAARVDTFPNTVLEALACGVPVVAAAVGGIPEQIEEGGTGFLVSAGDRGAMAQGIVTLLSDEPLRRRLGAQAEQTAKRRFCLDRQIGSHLAWYHEILNARELMQRNS
jgi:glycosyltransferase involved in cell wall biosynthesis